MKNLKKDLFAYSGGSFAKAISTVMFNEGFRAIKNYRLAYFMYKKMHMRLFPRILRWHNRVKYAIDIDFRCDISEGFKVVHGAGLVIGKDVRIGKNVSIYQGVTLGGNSEKTNQKDGVVFSQPWLGDNVSIFANCTVIGPVYIGDNSVIGAGSVVLKDIPANSVCFSKNEMVIKEKVMI